MFKQDTSTTHEANSNGNFKRSPDYIAWRESVSDELEKNGLSDVATNFRNCSNFPKTAVSSETVWFPPETETVWVCSDNPQHHNVIFSNTCDCRICPDCARRNVARLAARYVPLAIRLSNENSRHTLRHIILTTPYSLEDDDIEEKWAFFTSMVISIFDELLNENWRKNQGLLVAFEFGETGHKLHAHILHYGQYISQAELSVKLSNATHGEASIVWIRSLMGKTEKDKEHAIIETLKYSVKFWKTDATGAPHYIDPALMPKLHNLLKGTRRIRSYGLFYGIGEPETMPFSCPDCGKPMARLGLEHWPIYKQTGFLRHEWDAIKRSTLNLKLANKSKNEGGNANKKTAKQRMLPMNMPAFEPKRMKKQ